MYVPRYIPKMPVFTKNGDVNSRQIMQVILLELLKMSVPLCAQLNSQFNHSLARSMYINSLSVLMSG
jgi:hypothetical protein